MAKRKDNEARYDICKCGRSKYSGSKKGYLKKIKELLNAPEESSRLDFLLKLNNGELLSLGMQILRASPTKPKTK